MRLHLIVFAFIIFSVFPSTLSAQATSATNQQGATTGEHQFDGPAELPRVHVASSMADTPAPGRRRSIKQGDDLQAAIDDAKCGDVLQLQAGATFTGVYRFPKKSCDDSHWIIIRTSAPDSSLPPEGTRLTPCYAGVASLPGRPDYHCSSPHNALAKLVLDHNSQGGPVVFLDGANHYRFLGLEITRSMPEVHYRNLVQVAENDGAADHLIFDRLWLHGNPQDETKGGIHLSGITYAAIVDSYFNDFKCIARNGSCTDAQAVNGGTGDKPSGSWKIENNFLEASGQSILIGGAGATTTPTDIEIRRNHVFKPIIWKPGEPGFVGAYTGDPFIAKNNLELKNSQRVLIEGNVFENSWGGFTQAGFSLVIMPANQAGFCPVCRVTDVTIRYNKIIRVGSALDIADIPQKKGPPAAGERYSIHDLLVQEIKGEPFKGFGLFALLVSHEPLLKDVRIDHVTAFPLRAILSIQTTAGQKISGFSLTNSLFDAGQFVLRSAGGHGQNCAAGIHPGDVAGILDSCLSNPVITHNLIMNSYPWPKGNIVVKDSKAAGLWKASDDQEGYRVCSAKDEAKSCDKVSPAYHAATDGKDIGADIKAIEDATRDVL